MKTKVGLRIAGICSTFAAVVMGQNDPAGSEPPKPSPQPPPITSATVAPETAMTLAEAQKVLSTARKYVAHPVPSKPGERRVESRVVSPDFEMDTPPPPPRPETKPAPPDPGYVWVPGHYMPVKGKWRWVRGEWAVPATPSSVWIAASYDAKERKWSPGYWQPDKPSAPESETPSKDPATPLPSRY